MKSVTISYGGTLRCSGTLVDDDTVLTAGHCVSRGEVSKFRVCTYGNSDSRSLCRQVTSYTVGPDYSDRNQTPENDYAVMELRSALNVGWMPLSEASKGSLVATPHHKAGYPAMRPGTCSYNQARRPDVYNLAYDAPHAYESTGDVLDVWTGCIGFNMDTSSGDSGSAVYYLVDRVPPGCAREGAIHTNPVPYLSGVVNHVMYHWADPMNTGARSRAIRAWVINNM